MYRRSYIAAAIFFVIVSSSDTHAQTQSITLNEALEMARRVNPQLIQAEGAINIAQASRRESLGDWLPSVSGSSGWSTNSTSRFDPQTQRTVDGSATSMSASLSASMVIFDGFRRNAQGRARTADYESAEITLISQEFQIALQTKQAFFNAVAAEELVRVSETRIDRATQQLDIARNRLAAGSAIRSDTLSSFVELGNARLQLLNAQTQLAGASANLARLVGVDGLVRAVADSNIQFQADLDTAFLREEALANGPGVQQAIAQSRAAQAQVTVSRAQYFPSVSASYNRSISGAGFSTLNPSWSTRLSLSWSIFNGFTRETNVVRSRIQADVADAQVEDIRRQINAQLTQQFASIQSALVRLEIAEASRVAAQEDLRVQQERYRLGAGT
ncbi:MAG: TolC family protein, partial [Gemmatimonadota bacterium]|nr:TolC family protein [Gemmatimonadota bacterium]